MGQSGGIDFLLMAQSVHLYILQIQRIQPLLPFSYHLELLLIGHIYAYPEHPFPREKRHLPSGQGTFHHLVSWPVPDEIHPD